MKLYKDEADIKMKGDFEDKYGLALECRALVVQNLRVLIGAACGVIRL